MYKKIKFSQNNIDAILYHNTIENNIFDPVSKKQYEILQTKERTLLLALYPESVKHIHILEYLETHTDTQLVKNNRENFKEIANAEYGGLDVSELEVSLESTHT